MFLFPVSCFVFIVFFVLRLFGVCGVVCLCFVLWFVGFCFEIVSRLPCLLFVVPFCVVLVSGCFIVVVCCVAAVCVC